MTSPPYLIDGRPLGGRSGQRGIGTYLRGLMRGFAEIGVSEEIQLVMSRGTVSPLEVRAGGSSVGPRIPPVKRRLQPTLDPLFMSWALRKSGARVYHSAEWSQPLIARVPVAITVHDLIPFIFPDQYPWMRRERLLALRLLRRADAVIADSECTARDVERLGRVDPARIDVVHLGVEERFRPVPSEDAAPLRKRLNIDTVPYVLAVGTFDPRKRLSLLIDVLRRLRRDAPVRLIIAGEQGAYLGPVTNALEAAGLSDATTVVGRIADEDLIRLYGGAACLLFTSAYEGFGLPVLEAMACGCPVAAFTNSTLSEIGGPAAVLVDDGDTAAMAAAVGRLVGEQDAQEARRALGQRHAAGFTWKRCAEKTLGVYRRLDA